MWLKPFLIENNFNRQLKQTAKKSPITKSQKNIAVHFSERIYKNQLSGVLTPFIFS
jgi:hypothetical protein